MIITSKDNKYIKDLRKLNEKKYRDKNKKFLVEGIHLVKEAYKTGNLLEILLVDDDYNDIDVKKTFITSEVMKSISSLETPYNVIGVCAFKEDESYGEKILILDGLQDPGNIGTIIRSAVAFNIDTIVLSEGCVDVYNSKVLRASQGMNFHINILKKELNSFILSLKEKDYLIYGTNVKNGEKIKSARNSSKYAIIVGNEGNGVSSDIQKLCDKNIYIEMNKKCESLNVAVATSILLYELSN